MSLRFISRFLLIICAVAFLRHAYAFSCAPPQHDMDSVRERLVSTESVVLGRVEATGKTVWINDWGRASLATVSVERVFRGDMPRTLELFINSNITVGQRVIFYVHKESTEEAKQRARWVSFAQKPPSANPEYSEQPQLRADSVCSHAHVLADSDDGRSHLKHLAALPPVGSGGSLRLRIEARNGADWSEWSGVRQALQPVPISISANSTTYSGRIDDKGEVRFDNIPSGRYALQLPKVDGFTLKCTSYPSMGCGSLEVKDQALHRYNAYYDPNAAVEIKLLSADGHPVDAVANFRLTRVGVKVERKQRDVLFQAPSTVVFSNALLLIAEGHLRRHAAVLPGQFSLELLLNDMEPAPPTEATGYAPFKSIRNESIRTAKTNLLDLRPGNNVIEFKLPSKLTPKTITVKFSAPPGALKGKPNLNAWLYAQNSAGRGQQISTMTSHTKALKDETGWTFVALPDQSWQLYVSEYQSGLDAEGFVRVKDDAAITLQMTARKKR